MGTQNYRNHIRYYTAHHFIFYPVIISGIAASVVGIFRYKDYTAIWVAITLIFIVIGWLSFMVRQHYSLGNQNRIVRLEMRLRYYQLTQQRLEDIESKLSFSQIAALRFAGDEELPALIQQTLEKNLLPKEIKKSIKNWQPDLMRV